MDDGERDGARSLVEVSTEATDLRPFVDFIDRTQHLHDLLELMYVSVREMEGYQRLVEVLHRHDGTRLPSDDEGETDPSTGEERVQRAARVTSLARAEVAADFATLNGAMTILLWASLELLVDDAMVAWVLDQPSAVDEEAARRIRVPVTSLLTMPAEDGARLLVAEVRAQSSVRSGLSVFEEPLNVVGLGGPVTDWARKDLFELQQCRNVFAHRAGRVDERLIDACPWLEVSLGQPLAIEPERMRSFFRAAFEYAACIRERYPDQRRDEVDEVETL